MHPLRLIKKVYSKFYYILYYNVEPILMGISFSDSNTKSSRTHLGSKDQKCIIKSLQFMM